MIEPIPDMPDGTLGFEAVGEVTADDYRGVMAAPVKEIAASGERVRMLYLVGHRFDRFSAGAVWEDAKFGLEPVHWERVALVTDVDWMRHLAGAFGWMVPGAFKTFEVADLETAKAWTAAVG